MLSGFKQFILRGNVVDLAVGVVIGASFGAVVNAAVKDVINPLVAAIGGQPDFSGFTLSIHGGHFLLGDLINTILSFLINATVIYFFVVLPVTNLMNRQKRKQPPATKKCPECLSDIPVGAKRCPFCTTVLKEAKA